MAPLNLFGIIIFSLSSCVETNGPPPRPPDMDMQPSAPISPPINKTFTHLATSPVPQLKSQEDEFNLGSDTNLTNPRRGQNIAPLLKLATSGRRRTMYDSQNKARTTGKTTTRTPTNQRDGRSVRLSMIISMSFVAAVLVAVVLGFCLNRSRMRRRSLQSRSNSSTMATVVNHQEIFLDSIKSTSTLNTTCQDLCQDGDTVTHANAPVSGAPPTIATHEKLS